MPSNSNPKYLTTPSNFQFTPPPPPPDTALGITKSHPWYGKDSFWNHPFCWGNSHIFKFYFLFCYCFIGTKQLKSISLLQIKYNQIILPAPELEKWYRAVTEISSCSIYAIIILIVRKDQKSNSRNESSYCSDFLLFPLKVAGEILGPSLQSQLWQQLQLKPSAYEVFINCCLEKGVKKFCHNAVEGLK